MKHPRTSTQRLRGSQPAPAVRDLRLLELAGIIADAKTNVLLAAAAHGDTRREYVEQCKRATERARELLPAIGGFERLPFPLAVALRVAERGAEALEKGASTP